MAKAAKSIKDKDQRISFLNDLNGVSGAWSELCFHKTTTLFIKKWSLVQSAASSLEKLRKEWLNPRLCRFYRGAAEGYSMNNNGLEAYNKVLKDSCTFHERLPINQLLPAMGKWIGDQSHRRDPQNINFLEFALEPEIKLMDVTEGYNLARKKIKLIQLQGHYICVNDNRIQGNVFDRNMANAIFTQYRECNWKTLDQYNAFQSQVHVITPDRKCNCYQFGKKFKCAHVECVKIMIDRAVVPEAAKIIPLHVRRKPGRPKQALGRYVRQDYAPDFANDDDDDNDHDDDEGDDYGGMDDDSNDFGGTDDNAGSISAIGSSVSATSAASAPAASTSSASASASYATYSPAPRPASGHTSSSRAYTPSAYTSASAASASTASASTASASTASCRPRCNYESKYEHNSKKQKIHYSSHEALEVVDIASETDGSQSGIDYESHNEYEGMSQEEYF